MSDGERNSGGMESTADSGTAPELAAPVTDEATCHELLATGVDAVCLRIEALISRKRSGGISYDRVSEIVRAARAQGARAYVVFDLDVAEREIEVAARVLEVARAAQCAAVVVRDPALLALREAFPELAFHFNEQTPISNTADALAASTLGAARVVPARELDLLELRALGGQREVPVEVVEDPNAGYGLAGHCLLGSWLTGQSEHRGFPLPVSAVKPAVSNQPEAAAGGSEEPWLLSPLNELRAAGACALRIDGRRVSPQWVLQAAGVYRRILDGEEANAWADEFRRLRPAASRADLPPPVGQGEDLAETKEAYSAAEAFVEHLPDESPDGSSAPGRGSTYDLELYVAPKGIELHCQCAGIEEKWTIPKTVVHRPHKAVSVETLFQRLSGEALHGCELGQMSTNEPEFLLVPRAVNALVARISKIVQRGQRNRSELVAVKLPPTVHELLRKPVRHPGCQTPLGDVPDRARLEADSVEEFLAHVRPSSVIVEGVKAAKVRAVRALCRRSSLVIALPPVFFEAELDEIRALLQECARANLIVEVNSWGGWHLAKEAGVRMEGGPGLPVLNSLAARTLAKAGFEGVTLALEGDRRQFEEVTAFCPLPSSLYVFGRPILMIARTKPPDDMFERLRADRPELRLITRREIGLWVLRPDEPFDLRGLENERIRVKHLVVDLVGSPDPLDEWQRAPGRGKPAFLFNYERGLA